MALLISTRRICFIRRNKKSINTFLVQRRALSWMRGCTDDSLCLPYLPKIFKHHNFPLYLHRNLNIIKGLNSPVMTVYEKLIHSRKSFCLPFKLMWSLWKKKTKRATTKNKGAEQSAWMCRLICALVVHTCIKPSFLSGSYEDLNHGSSTSRTTFCWYLNSVLIYTHGLRFCADKCNLR